jgi:hypothetical protein
MAVAMIHPEPGERGRGKKSETRELITAPTSSKLVPWGPRAASAALCLSRTLPAAPLPQQKIFQDVLLFTGS